MALDSQKMEHETERRAGIVLIKYKGFIINFVSWF